MVLVFGIYFFVSSKVSVTLVIEPRFDNIAFHVFLVVYIFNTFSSVFIRFRTFPYVFIRFHTFSYEMGQICFSYAVVAQHFFIREVFILYSYVIHTFFIRASYRCAQLRSETPLQYENSMEKMNKV